MQGLCSKTLPLCKMIRKTMPNLIYMGTIGMRMEKKEELLEKQTKPMHPTTPILAAKKKLAHAFAFAWMATQCCNQNVHQHAVDSCLDAVISSELVRSVGVICWLHQFAPTSAWCWSSIMFKLEPEPLFNESKLS